MTFNLYDTISENNSEKLNSWVDFLFSNLGKYRDTKEEILLAIKYALGYNNSAGGFVLECIENEELIAVAVLNKTGMVKYIPANILVYISVSENVRGKGIGKLMLELIITETQGGIALHVEPDNPAIKLYNKLGFENKYLEMRYQHKS